MGIRQKVEWGNWGITLYAEADGKNVFFGKLYFPVGPQGPIDGHIGSPERARWLKACSDWMSGRCPDGTQCDLSQRWLYENYRRGNS